MKNNTKIAHFLKAIDNFGLWTARVSGFFSVMLFVAMVIVALVGILFRYVMRNPFEWTEESARFLMLVIVFLSINTALRAKAHIAVTYFVDRLPPPAARILDYLGHALIGFFLVFLLKQGLSMTAGTLMTASTIHISMRWLYMFVPLGAFFTLIQLVIRIIENLCSDLGWVSRQ